MKSKKKVELDHPEATVQDQLAALADMEPHYTLTDEVSQQVVDKSITELKKYLANPTVIKFKKLDEKAIIPQYAHDGDAGMDVTAISVEYDEESDCYIYHTGLALESDKNVVVLGFPRSSIYKTECYQTNSVGIIDSATYRGEIQWRFKNRLPVNYRVWSLTLYNYSIEPFWKKITKKQREKLLQKIQDANYKMYKDFPLMYAPYAVGDRIGQLMVLDLKPVQVQEVTELSETERGAGGFGSTGK